ncbi:polysaccharide deacetylase [Iodidimonas muriae]|uniref:Chitooligosaccharide deacetylase n=2 Tax=Iodidimonas muriae TaxID=261467 RepID=A0ABQ2L680_9PROT|nr:XrtA system polysaccharide deacetylase [Iodidimonas muriae]GER06472.1 polysaccharide deacetylase [Kordiimonadales bacterium JCM 17843]GGO04897.1 polysaccharide deacetylase [Iodidimonas muriae]
MTNRTGHYEAGHQDRLSAGSPILNAMSVDVEDYFQVSAMEPVVSRDDWDGFACRVEQNTHRILDLFDRHGATATFFTLGWVAKRYPALVRAIAERGHEVASHGMQHMRVSSQSQNEFRADIRKAKALLEDAAGVAVRGYRAASFSMTKQTDWAHRVLAEEGYAYSSSIYPIKHDHYGIPDAERGAYHPLEGSDFLEIPISTIEIAGKRLPCGGGGYFRLLPYGLSRWMMRRVNRRDRMPCIFYFHPWEVDPSQPHMDGIGMKTRFRHYTNLSKMYPRLDRLLSTGPWRRMDEIFLTRQEQ